MKKFITKTIAIILAFSLVLSLTFVSSAEDVIISGNTLGNIANKGYISIQGDYLYFNNFYEKKLYKMKKDGTSKQLITNDVCQYINVVGDWIYYVSSLNEQIYKIKTDGTSKIHLYDYAAKGLQVIGDWIYFYSFNLMKMKIDGTNVTNISNYNPSFFNVVNDIIYFAGDNSYGGSKSNIYSINTDGTHFNELCDNYSSFSLGKYGQYYNGTLYYINKRITYSADKNPTTKIFKFNIAENTERDLPSPNCKTLNVANDSIYYISSEDGYVYKMNLDGSDAYRFSDIKAGAIYIDGTDIYIAGEDFGSIFYIKDDGTAMKLLYNFIAPTSLKVLSKTYDSITLTWNEVADAAGYAIYLYNGSKYCETVNTPTNSHIFTSLSTGKTYIYKVAAYVYVDGVKKYSGLSNYVSEKLILNAPGSFAAARVSASKIKVSWAAVSGASGYTVYRYNGKSYIAIANITTLNYTNIGLTKNTTYYYKVAAYRTVNGAKVYSAISAYKGAKTY